MKLHSRQRTVLNSSRACSFSTVVLQTGQRGELSMRCVTGIFERNIAQILHTTLICGPLSIFEKFRFSNYLSEISKNNYASSIVWTFFYTFYHPGSNRFWANCPYIYGVLLIFPRVQGGNSKAPYIRTIISKSVRSRLIECVDEL